MKFALALVLAALAACTEVVGLDYAVALVPADPTFLPRLWDHLTACSGIGGNLSDVYFYRVEQITRANAGTEDVTFGYWVKDGNKVFIAEPWVNDSLVVMHEMMHAKLQGGEDHPAEYFDGKCGNLMKPLKL